MHPVNSFTTNVDGIHLRSSGSYSGTVTTSSGTSGGTGSVSLSSPESAYSTGYSTDGTSPGASFPPEYYINIRTGTHYFQNSNKGKGSKRGPVENERPIPSGIPSGNGRTINSTNKSTTMTRDNELQPKDVRANTPTRVSDFFQ